MSLDHSRSHGFFYFFQQALAMKDESEAYARTTELCASFLGLGVILFVAAIIQSHSLAKTASNLVLRLR